MFSVTFLCLFSRFVLFSLVAYSMCFPDSSFSFLGGVFSTILLVCRANDDYYFRPFTAEPPISSSSDPIVHRVTKSESGIVSTVLGCDIKPGALVQRYSVQWLQITRNSTAISNNISSSFNLTLSVNTSVSISLVYQCEVTVNHDGNISATYTGTLMIVEVQGW